MRRTQIRARPNLDDGPSPWLVAFRERVDGYIADAARAEGEEAAERGVTVDELPALWKTDAAIEAARKTRTRTQIEGEIREQFPGDLEGMTLDSFNPQSDSQSAALVGARAWVADYTAAVVGMGKRPSQGMILFGRNGRGKTHIAAGVLKAITSPLVTIRFVNVPLFLDEMRQSFADGPGSRAGVMLARCLDVDVLVPHVQRARLVHRREYQLLLESGQVPKGMRQDVIYLDRFNLNASQAHLLHGGVGRDRPGTAIGRFIAGSCWSQCTSTSSLRSSRVYSCW